MSRKIYPDLPGCYSYHKIPDLVQPRIRGQEENAGYHDNSCQGYLGGNHGSYPEQIIYRVNKKEYQPNCQQDRDCIRRPLKENRVALYNKPGYDPINVSKLS